MTRFRAMSLLAIVALAAGGGWFALSHRQAAPPPAPRSAEAGAIAVTTAPVVQLDMPVVKRAIGFVETPASVVVRSRIDSQIVGQSVTDGQFVTKGDLLFTLDDRDVRAQIAKDEAAIARDEATHRRAEADLARYQQLLARNAGTQQQVDQSTAEERSTAATIQADKATLDADRLKLGYTRIEAPITGRIGAVQVTPGNLVSANASGTALLTITQMKPIRVTFTLPERELPALQAALARGAPVSVTALVPGTHLPPARGVVDFVDSGIDTKSGTITVKGTFANDDLALWPGQYVNVELGLDTLRDVAVVPTVAIQPGQAGPFVYVVVAGDTVALRRVTVALADGDRTAIRDGVKPGERVVVDGQLRLKDGARIRERGSEAVPADPRTAKRS